ncbi:hypothetical protein Vretimale_13556 [Volvox reticuliferus]|uniref:ubiquitinyl hydrolase 1 n=1 Tax=Volvox reticuliferus TaxID=1737510 RepID=A0A8J4GKL7_9CHLO|nr:hypothetical protein Vretimale_13556 [Volvox reticuliferus]
MADTEIPSTAHPQRTWGADDGGAAAGAAAAGHRDAGATTAAPFTGPPFLLKLCNNKGDSMLWNLCCGTSEKDIKVEHNREFLLMFSDATGGVDGVPYAAELLDTPSEHPSLGEHRRRVASGPQPVSLDACMTTFLQPERLAESDAWYCPRCKSHVCADKKLDLWSLPEVLVVHLKRFSYTRYSRNKLDTRVDFPLHSLDLGPYVMRPQAVSPMYDLFAVSNHYGSLGGGHYTAYAKLPSPFPGSTVDAHGAAAEAPSADRWYCFDDSHVSSVAPEAVRSPAAYVLFYRRRAEAAKDPPDVEDLLESLKQQRAELQHQLASAAGLVRGSGCPAGFFKRAAVCSGIPRSPKKSFPEGPRNPTWVGPKMFRGPPELTKTFLGAQKASFILLGQDIFHTLCCCKKQLYINIYKTDKATCPSPALWLGPVRTPGARL